MIRRPPRSTPLYSSAASDVYKRQVPADQVESLEGTDGIKVMEKGIENYPMFAFNMLAVSYTHLRAHET